MYNYFKYLPLIKNCFTVLIKKCSDLKVVLDILNLTFILLYFCAAAMKKAM